MRQVILIALLLLAQDVRAIMYLTDDFERLPTQEQIGQVIVMVARGWDEWPITERTIYKEATR